MNMSALTQGQRSLLINIGKPDDGYEQFSEADKENLIHELLALGLVDCTGMSLLNKECFDLTEEGERVFAELTG
jgi:hypothetical protein